MNDVIACVLGASLYQLRGEAAPALRHAERAVTLASQQHFPLWGAYGLILQGWALAMQEQGEEGIQFLRRGMANTEDMGTDVARSWFLLMLAEICVKTNRSEEGLTAVEAFESAQKRSEGFCMAELHRLKGELTLAQSSVQSLESRVQTNQKAKGKRQKKLSVVSSQFSVPNAQSPTSKAQSEAEACFLKAIDISRKQQAKSLELRATMSLARLWQQQGKTAEAHSMLSNIYNWFTEGFDTKDLQEAKALLDSLASSVEKVESCKSKVESP